MLCLQEYETFSTPLSSFKLPIFSAVMFTVREESVGEGYVDVLKHSHLR